MRSKFSTKWLARPGHSHCCGSIKTVTYMDSICHQKRPCPLQLFNRRLIPLVRQRHNIRRPTTTAPSTKTRRPTTTAPSTKTRRPTTTAPSTKTRRPTTTAPSTKTRRPIRRPTATKPATGTQDTDDESSDDRKLTIQSGSSGSLVRPSEPTGKTCPCEQETLDISALSTCATYSGTLSLHQYSFNRFDLIVPYCAKSRLGRETPEACSFRR
jgi:hypothetical protein